MRHRKDSKKLGRSAAHRQAMLAALLCALVRERRIRTTLSKARLARRLAERLVMLGRRGTLADRRRALAWLRRADAVQKLVAEIVPACAGRTGGFTRLVKLGPRRSDAAEMAILEWVGLEIPDRRKKRRPKAEGQPSEKERGS